MDIDRAQIERSQNSRDEENMGNNVVQKVSEEEDYEMVAAACVIDETDDENTEVQQLKEGMNI